MQEKFNLKKPIIGNDDTSKQRAVVTVFFYSKTNVKICEVQDFKSNSQKTLIKEVTDFMCIPLPILKG